MSTASEELPSRGQDRPTDEDGAGTAARTSKVRLWRLLLRDKAATLAACVLALVALTAVVGPVFLSEAATAQNLDLANRAPFDTANGWINVLGTDPLGRSVLARLVVASRTTLAVALPAVLLSLVIGASIGMWAGFHRGLRETVAMRVADVIMSFPSLLLAVVVLFVFSPSIANIVLVLAITRIPVYLRTARAEAAEIRSRVFVDAARTFGTSNGAIIRRHVLPILLPTLLTVATLDFAFVMLAEASLSFLGIGIQPPDVSWGLLVANGRTYLQTAWWLAFFPGLAIVLTTVSATVLSAWARLATDPSQRWRLSLPRSGRRPRSVPTEEVQS